MFVVITEISKHVKFFARIPRRMFVLNSNLARSHQGPVPRGHGHVMAPRGIQLCSLPLLPGDRWVRGGEGPGVLRTMLRGVPRSLLRQLPAEDPGGELQDW